MSSVQFYLLSWIQSLERRKALEGKARVMPRLPAQPSMSSLAAEEERKNPAEQKSSRRCWATSRGCRSSGGGPDARAGRPI